MIHVLTICGGIGGGVGGKLPVDPGKKYVQEKINSLGLPSEGSVPVNNIKECPQKDITYYVAKSFKESAIAGVAGSAQVNIDGKFSADWEVTFPELAVEIVLLKFCSDTVVSRQLINDENGTCCNMP